MFQRPHTGGRPHFPQELASSHQWCHTVVGVEVCSRSGLRGDHGETIWVDDCLIRNSKFNYEGIERELSHMDS